MSDDEKQDETTNENAGGGDRGLLTEENPAGGLPQNEFAHEGRNPDPEDLEDDDTEDDE